MIDWEPTSVTRDEYGNISLQPGEVFISQPFDLSGVVPLLRKRPRWKRVVASPRFVWRLHFRTGLPWIAALRMARLVVQA